MSWVPESDEVRVDWLERVLAATILMTLWLGRRAFLGDPLFAPLPVLGWPSSLPWPIAVAWLGLLIAAVAVLPLAGHRRARVAALWCGLFVARSMWDEVLWQPYFLQYVAMVAAVAVARCGAPPASALAGCRLIMASIYLWSGIAKLNPVFLGAGIPSLLRPLWPTLSPDFLAGWSFVIPLLEIGLGLGLMLGRARRASLAGATLMHASLLAYLGPWGLDYNPIVWPWNVAMVLFLWILFPGAPRASLLWVRGSRFHHATLLLFTLCPALAYLGLWPAYLSFSLYSYDYHYAAMLVKPALLGRLPESARSRLQGGPTGDYAGYIVIPHWSEASLGLFAPPEPRVYRRIAARVCAVATSQGDAMLLLLGRPRPDGGRDEQSVSCDQLR